MNNSKKIRVPPPILGLILYTLGVLLLIFCLKYFTILAAPLLFAFIIAYLFNPLVNFLEKRLRLSRGFVAAVLMIGLLCILVLIMMNLFPYIIKQANNAAVKVPELLKIFSQKVDIFSNYLTKNFSEYIGNVDITEKFDQMIGRMFLKLSDLLATAFSSLYSLLLSVLYLVFIPLVAFYFIKDNKKIHKTIFGLIPIRSKANVIQKVEKLDKVLASFIRGQAIVVLILAILYSVGLKLIGLPFGMMIGIASGIGDFIPYLGTIAGFIISMIVGFAHFQSYGKLLLIVLVFAVVKGSENWIFYPKIVGKEVGLHFVWVLLAIVIFGNLFGFWGLLVAIPATAGFKIFIHDVFNYYRDSDFYNKSRSDT